MHRKGNCWQASYQKLIDLNDPTVMLVHGLPVGQNGDAAKVGFYPHGWLECGGLVWEPSLDKWMPRSFFYQLGNIDYSIAYTRTRAMNLLVEWETYGPWDKRLLDRDEEIDEILLQADLDKVLQDHYQP